MIELHEGCRRELINKLSKYLSEIYIDNIFIDFYSTLTMVEMNKILPQKGEVHALVGEYLGEGSIYGFITGYLQNKLHDNLSYDNDSGKRLLKDINGFENLTKLAEEIIDGFITLPWEYFFMVETSDDFSRIFCKNVGIFEVSNDINIMNLDENSINKLNLKKAKKRHDNALLDLMSAQIEPQFVYDENKAYIKINKKGYVNKWGINETIDKVILDIKSIYGVLIGLNLLKIDKPYGIIPKIPISIFINNNSKWEFYKCWDIEDDFARGIKGIMVNDFNGKIKNDQGKAILMIQNLLKLKILFNNAKKAEKILLASQWLFDSNCGENELLNFIQTMVALEILLGEKKTSDLIGLGELLANRSAYLIGYNNKQRNDILQKFKDIYNIRSKIVHRGKRKLSLNELFSFDQLKWICSRVIQEEIDLIEKDKDD